MQNFISHIPTFDARSGGLTALCEAHVDAARGMRRAVLNSHGKLAAVVSRGGLPIADRLSRRWMLRTDEPYRDEIERFAEAVGAPGVVTLNLSYEWGCTSLVRDEPDGPRLFRVLDWPYPGLGRSVMAVQMPGDWSTLTWPAVSSVLQASAQGRFAAALNQAPQRQTGWGRGADWLVGKPRFLRERGMLPGHLLRQVFETAPDYEAAKQALRDTPVCVPVIYILAGATPGEGCVIERTETEARVIDMQDGAVAAANHFDSDLSQGHWRNRGEFSRERADYAARGGLDALLAEDDFSDLPEPIRNETTRLVMSACPATGAFSAQGWESGSPVTRPTNLQTKPHTCDPAPLD